MSEQSIAKLVIAAAGVAVFLTGVRSENDMLRWIGIGLVMALVFRADDHSLVGASVVGEGACELIHIPAAVIALKGSLDYFIQSVFNYPTLSDAFKYAAYDGLQRLQRRVSRAMEERSRVATPRVGSDPAPPAAPT